MSAATDQPTVSFELFPPRQPENAPKLWAAITALASARPDFVSVTYGASGKTRDTTRGLVRRLLRETSLNPIAHLTCVGASRAEVTTVIEEFLDEGVRSFLALRGDPPTGAADWHPHPEGMRTAAELVALLREIEADRSAKSPAQRVRGSVRPLSIAVAAFPRGNAGAGSTREQDIAALLAKQHAGADFAITQVFYEAEAYLELVTLAKDAGVTIPIIPGIIPATDPDRLLRVQALSGVEAPPALIGRLAATDGDERHRLGIRMTADLVRAVLAGGAPGVHIYTFNTADAALDLLEAVGLRGARLPRPHQPPASPPTPPTPTTSTHVHPTRT